MIIEEVKNRKLIIDLLMQIWESSVKATHLFLSSQEINNLKQYVPEALTNIQNLVIAKDDSNIPVAFAGVEGRKLEMLFVSAEKRGCGIGKQLMQFLIKNFFIDELTVNEQNPLALGFYEHMGFKIYKRAEKDEQGNPYPIFYMKRG